MFHETMRRVINKKSLCMHIQWFYLSPLSHMKFMTYFSTWSEALRASWQTVWLGLVAFLPRLLGAIVIFIIGLIIATVLAALVRRLLEYARVDELLRRSELMRSMQARGRRWSISGFLAWLVKWFVIIVSLITVSDVLGIPRITAFLTRVTTYFPNVIVAVVILTIGLLVGDFMESLVVSAISASRIPTSSAGFLGATAKWAIVIFSILAALVQLGVATSLVQILFIGLVAMVALAGGLAFGLGGREKATKWLDHMEQEMAGK